MSDAQTDSRNDETDEYGNYAHSGDLYVRGEDMDTLVPRMLEQLRRTFDGYDFAPSRQSFAGGRSVTMSVISGPAGLTDRAACEAFTIKVVKEMERFTQSSGNVLGDSHKTSLFTNARIDPRYHAQHAEVVEGTSVESTMTLSAFKKTLKAGDRIVMLATNNPYSQKMVGQDRTISQVRSGDFIIGEGKQRSYFDFPKAGAFACDGERFRVTDASEHQPDGYRLYQWIRS